MINKDERINELLANKEFFKKITSVKTVEEVVDAFKEKGVEISTEEVQEIGAMINEVIGKLNEEDLENVSGGAGPKARQFRHGWVSGMFGPVFAYGHAGNSIYIEPKTKGEKAARYAGIAAGVASAGLVCGIPWLSGALVEGVTRLSEPTEKKFKKKSEEKKDS